MKILFMILLLGLVAPINAEIDIYYPNNNTTTEIWYATDVNPVYTHVENNTVPNSNYTHVILRNKVSDSTNVIEDPILIINEFNKMFYLLVLIFGIIVIVYSVKKVVR